MSAEEKGGLKAGRDFFLAFSPERENPGDPVYSASNTPKVVGGFTKARSAGQARVVLRNAV